MNENKEVEFESNEGREAEGPDHIGLCRPWSGAWLLFQAEWEAIEGSEQGNDRI